MDRTQSMRCNELATLSFDAPRSPDGSRAELRRDLAAIRFSVWFPALAWPSATGGQSNPSIGPPIALQPGGVRLRRSSRLKPAKVTLFTMIFCNPENSIRDIRPFYLPLFRHNSVMNSVLSKKILHWANVCIVAHEAHATAQACRHKQWSVPNVEKAMRYSVLNLECWKCARMNSTVQIVWWHCALSREHWLWSTLYLSCSRTRNETWQPSVTDITPTEFTCWIRPCCNQEWNYRRRTRLSPLVRPLFQRCRASLLTVSHLKFCTVLLKS